MATGAKLADRAESGGDRTRDERIFGRVKTGARQAIILNRVRKTDGAKFRALDGREEDPSEFLAPSGGDGVRLLNNVDGDTAETLFDIDVDTPPARSRGVGINDRFRKAIARSADGPAIGSYARIERLRGSWRARDGVKVTIPRPIRKDLRE